MVPKENEEFVTKLGIYNISELSLAKKDISSDTNVILLVISRCDSYKKRTAIRHMLINSTDLHFNYKLIFTFSSNSCIKMDLIQQENQVFSDLLIVQTDDNYRTVALKLFSAFNFIHNLTLSSLKWLVKLDDDIILNTYKLDEYLRQNGSYFKGSIQCRVNNGIPMRDINQKW